MRVARHRDATRPSLALPPRRRGARARAATSIAGCDGFHGVCRAAVPAGVLRVHERDYPFAWLGILAEAAPVERRADLRPPRARLRAAQHALARGHPPLPAVSPPDETSSSWPDERIWEELQRAARQRATGPAQPRDRSSRRASRRCAASSPSRCSTAGSTSPATRSHIVPPTGAKGLNLAVADVRVLAAGARRAGSRRATTRLLAATPTPCLRRVWRAQHFSWWMTSMLHRIPDDHDGFQAQLQLAQLRLRRSSRAAVDLAGRELRGPAGLKFKLSDI